MKKKATFFASIGILLSLFLFQYKTNSFAQTNKTSPKQAAIWQGKMRELYKILIEVATDTSSDEKFNSPKNQSRILNNAKKLSELSHDISDDSVSPDADPTVKMISGMFQGDANRAYWALKTGNRAYARGILNQVSGYCIQCHTRNNSGPNFSKMPLNPSTAKLPLIEQGRFFAATRQYDKAFDIFLKIADDPSSPIQKPLEWERALRYGLSIAIRVKNDPDQAQALIERILGAKKAPYFFKQDALQWKRTVQQWKSEIPKRALTEEGLYLEAVQLISQARDLQKYPMDHAADVGYLRATSVIHELLQKYPDGHHAQDTLLLAGIAYEVLRPITIDNIHETYYEACIRKTPHTSIAENCYKRYEQSTYEGFTGSSGTHLPGDIIKKLHELENLALPQQNSKEETNLSLK